jgi:hypothetical protein
VTTSLLAAIRQHGVEVSREGGELVCRAPLGVLTDEAREVLAALKPEILAELEAEAGGWMPNPDGPGWVETPERATACVFCPAPLAAGNLIYCAGHEARATARFGYAVGRDAPPAGQAAHEGGVPASRAGGHRDACAAPAPRPSAATDRSGATTCTPGAGSSRRRRPTAGRVSRRRARRD